MEKREILYFYWNECVFRLKCTLFCNKSIEHINLGYK